MKKRIFDSGILELVGTDEQVDQNDYSGSVSLTLARPDIHGEILSVSLISTEDSTGTVLQPTGKLFVFDADPSISSGDTKIDQASYAFLVGVVDIASGDWVADDEGAVAFISEGDAQLPLPFSPEKTLYFAFLNTLATSINSAAGDDEQLEMRAFYSQGE